MRMRRRSETVSLSCNISWSCVDCMVVLGRARISWIVFCFLLLCCWSSRVIAPIVSSAPGTWSLLFFEARSKHEKGNETARQQHRFTVPQPRKKSKGAPVSGFLWNPNQLWCQKGYYEPSYIINFDRANGLSTFRLDAVWFIDFSAKILIYGFNGSGTVTLSLISENPRSKFMLEVMLSLC